MAGVMHYLTWNEIKSIQIDHNSTCNLRCPQCARTVKGETNPDLPMGELSVSDYQELFKGGLLDQIQSLIWCGNFGDVIVSQTFLPSVQWIASQGYQGEYVIITNGSAQSTDWWRQLARTIGKKGRVHFSIDGLSDTNHIYRVNSRWDKIMDNVKAFIDEGGRARWDYLVFGHNEHQMEEARNLAENLGFEDILFKKTNRFINDEHYKGTTKGKNDAQTVKTKKNEYTLESSKKYAGVGMSQHDQIIAKYGSWKNYLDQTKINCKWKPLGRLFLDFQARIWACTWTASGIYHFHESNTQRQQARQILDYYGWDFNSLREHSLEDILSHEYFNEKLTESWKGTTDDKPIPKLLACGRTCGTDYEFTSVAKSNTQHIVFERDK